MQEGIRAHVQHELDQWAKLGIDYSRSMRAILAAQGRVWKGVKCDVERGPMKECYVNAGELAMRSPDFHYVEGLAYAGRDVPIVVEHAWVLDVRCNKIHDPTWGASEEAQYMGFVFSPSKHVALTSHFGTWDILTNYHRDPEMLLDALGLGEMEWPAVAVGK
jgi:hypothetical protein